MLAAVDPEQHAFCKPSVYIDAAMALLGSVEKNRVKRIIHATAFYQAALGLFRKQHKLPFTDLLHVHIAFFMMRAYEGYPKWNELDDDGPVIDPVPSDNLGSLLLRRKNVVLYRPDPDLLSASPNHLREVAGVALAELLAGINARLHDAGVDRDRAIGHSYFLIPAKAPYSGR